MDGDRPVKDVDKDRLGFRLVAEHLASVIVDQAVKNGLVFGIEGKWGSGKSTLINFTIEVLRRRKEPQAEVIEFSPWLVGDRDSLLEYLFDELTDAVIRVDPVDIDERTKPRTLLGKIGQKLLGERRYRLRRREKLRKAVGGKLKAFGNIAGGLAKIVKAAGAAGVPYAELASAATERVAQTAKGFFSTRSLSMRKAEIIEALSLLSRRIVIFIDDLDRLEPSEASEVLRLIRAVADFPNIVYVLSYDPEVVAKTLKTAVRVDDGAAYLEKIVQVSFKVPRPEAFDLRYWFREELYELFAPELSDTADGSHFIGQRLATVIDIQGEHYLTTPRNVVRALNALRLHAIPVRQKIDIPDMVWLQLIRLGNPSLYTWIEEYMTETAAIYRRAGISAHAASNLEQRLEKIFTDEGVDVARAWIELSYTLPGIKTSSDKNLFGNLSSVAFNSFIVGRRLGSPEHYRFYFAFAQSAGALGDEQVEVFLALAEHDAAEATRTFSDLASQKRPQGGSMAEVMIDRIISAIDRISVAAIPGILVAFADNLDVVALASRDSDFGQHPGWESAERATSLLLRPVPKAERPNLLEQLFSRGSALGWLTSVLRGEIFSHGHYGDRPKPEEQRLLTPAEFQRVLAIILRRYAETPDDVLLCVPNLVSLLYCWLQASGNDDVKHRVRTITQSDDGLLAFLSRARGWTSKGNARGVVIRYPLQRRDLENFIEYEDAVRRVEKIAKSKDASSESRQLAEELLIAFKQDTDD
jgi:KAP family P-loop domain